MKLRFALVGLAALFGLAAAGSASAMPVALLSPASNVENVVVACGPSGCIRTAPVYRDTATDILATAIVAVSITMARAQRLRIPPRLSPLKP
jgi:hypothetical protein